MSKEAFDVLEDVKERNCENCDFRNEKYKILGCRLHNRQTRAGNCCSCHQFENEYKCHKRSFKYCEKCEVPISLKVLKELPSQICPDCLGYFEEGNDLEYPVSNETCKCGKKMYELSVKDADGYDIYEYLCTDPECDKKLIIQKCQHCEHESRWWEK